MTTAARTRDQLIADCQGLVKTLAWKIHRKVPSHVDLDDLVGYGQLGLAQAAAEYDPARGHQFTTYAYYRIRGAILDGLSKMAWFNKADYARGRYERLAQEVLDQEHPAAGSTPEEKLAHEARWLRDVSGSLAVVQLLCPRGSEEQESAEANVEDTLTPSPPQVAIRRELTTKLHELIDALPNEGRTLIRAAYFEGQTLKEAGEKLGISKAWASRLHAKTLNHLAQALNHAQLAD